MIKQNAFFALTGATLALAAGVVFVLPKTTHEATTYDHFFPSLYQQLNQVASITLRTHDNQFQIKNQDGNWSLPDKGNYPVDLGRIKEVLLGMADLVPLEEKTSNPDYYERLHLEDITHESSKATEIDLIDDKGQPIASLLIGKTQPAKLKPELSEVFVREPGKAKSWLTLGNLPTYTQATDWVNKSLLEIPETSIQSVEIFDNKHKSQLLITKATDKPNQFNLMNIPKDKTIDSQFSVNYVATTLAKLSLENIYLPTDVDFSAITSPTAVIKTTEGNTYNLFTQEKEGKTYVKLAVAAKDDKQANIEAMQEKFTHWIFTIPQYQAEELKKKTADLLKKPEK